MIYNLKSFSKIRTDKNFLFKINENITMKEIDAIEIQKTYHELIEPVKDNIQAEQLDCEKMEFNLNSFEGNAINI
jgi:hypothetical protein